MSSVFRFKSPGSSDWSDSAGFMAASLGLHIALALFLFLNQQPYGVKDGSTEIAFTEVTVAAAAPAALSEQAEAAPAPPEEPVVEPVVEPDVEPEELALPKETLPEPAPVEAKPEEPRPAPPAAVPAATEAQAAKPDAGGMPMPRGGQTLFCTHPPIHGRGTSHASQGYSVLGTPPGNGMGEADSAPVMRFGQDGGPTIIDFYMPQYPYNARVQNMEGEVFLSLRLDEKGALLGVSVLSSGGYEFDMAAIDAVSRSRFGPAVVDGAPVACKVVLPIRFTLN